MKRIIFAAAAALCLAMTTNADAQTRRTDAGTKERPNVEQTARRMTDRMTEALQLDEAQATQIYDLNLQRAQRMEEQRQQMQAARKAEAERMKSILTADQFAKWERMQGPKYGERRGHRPGDGRMATCDSCPCDKKRADCPRDAKGCCAKKAGRMSRSAEPR